MRSPSTFFLVALVWLAAASPSRATYIPWKYSWDNQPSAIHVDTPGTGIITLSDEPLRDAANTTNIVATNLQVFSTADPDHKEKVTNKGYTLTLFLLDDQSGKFGKMMFTGLLNGQISRLTSDLDNVFTGQKVQQLILGTHVFTVEMRTYTAPSPPNVKNEGAIGARAEVRVESISKTPEPSSLVLVGVGSTLGFAAWWRRRLLRGKGAQT
jgi:hypothetical protein